MRIVALNVLLGLALAVACFGQAAPAPSSSRPPVDFSKYLVDRDDPVATVAGQPVTEQELLDVLGPQKVMQMRTQEYETKSAALESLIRLKLVEAEAKKRGISAEKLLDQEVDSKIGAPTDGEVEAYFWGQNQAGARFEDGKEQYRATLRRIKLQKARQAYADSLRSKIDVAVMLLPPRVNVAYDPHRVKGNPQAPITIVEFSDFQCPYCKAAEGVLNELFTKYNGRVKLAYLDFPLREIHPKAEIAAEASRCAGDQGKFWEYHDSLYADQSKLDEPELVKRAAALNLNEGTFKSCLDSGKFKSQIQADVDLGTKVGIAGTPGFFVNGIFLNGAQPRAQFEKIIDGQLALVAGRNSSQ